MRPYALIVTSPLLLTVLVACSVHDVNFRDNEGGAANGLGGNNHATGGDTPAMGGEGGHAPATGGEGGHVPATGGKGTGGTMPVGGVGGDTGVGGTPLTQCYSPTQNLNVAYDGTLPGCPCDKVGDACVGGVALICHDGSWDAVEDGPCMPTNLDCDGRIESVEQCISLFDICVEMDPGTFCGMVPRTRICEGGELVSSQAGCYVDDAYCYPVGDSLWCTGAGEWNCPAGYEPTDAADCPLDAHWCVRGPGVQVCELPSYSVAECEDAGGTVVPDPGDGSVMAHGCPGVMIAEATVEGFIEGAFCCLPGPDTGTGGASNGGAGGAPAGGTGGAPLGGVGGTGGSAPLECPYEVVRPTDDPNDAYAVQPIEDFCRPNDSGLGLGFCASTPEEAMAERESCVPAEGAWKVQGCGYTQIGFSGVLYQMGYIFDDGTDELVGAYTFDVTANPACDVKKVYAGMMPDPCFDVRWDDGAQSWVSAGGAESTFTNLCD